MTVRQLIFVFAWLVWGIGMTGIAIAEEKSQSTTTNQDRQDKDKAEQPRQVSIAELQAEIKLLDQRLARIEKLLLDRTEPAVLESDQQVPLLKISPQPAQAEAELIQPDSGLVGRVVIEGQDQGIVFHYHQGRVFSRSDLPMQLLEGEKFKITMHGQLQLAERTKVKIWMAGGGVSHDVNWLYVDDREIGAVGDDRSKQLTKELDLDKGMHTVQWTLTGGTFRSNILILQSATGEALPLTVREQDQELLKDGDLKQVRIESREWGWPIPRDWNDFAGLIDPTS
jgi:hypothetical protein